MIVIVDGQEVDTSVVVDEEEIVLNKMDGFNEIDDLDKTIEFNFNNLEQTQELTNLEDTIDIGELMNE